VVVSKVFLKFHQILNTFLRKVRKFKWITETTLCRIY